MKDLTITIEIHSDKSIRLKENDKAVSYKSDNYYYPLLFAVVDKIHDAITDEKNQFMMLILIYWMNIRNGYLK